MFRVQPSTILALFYFPLACVIRFLYSVCRTVKKNNGLLGVNFYLGERLLTCGGPFSSPEAEVKGDTPEQVFSFLLWGIWGADDMVLVKSFEVKMVGKFLKITANNTGKFFARNCKTWSSWHAPLFATQMNNSKLELKTHLLAQAKSHRPTYQIVHRRVNSSIGYIKFS